jgi:hypothetical protein
MQRYESERALCCQAPVVALVLPTMVSLARLSSSIPGVSGSLLLQLYSSLTLCSLRNLTSLLLNMQLPFGSLASFLLCSLAGPLQSFSLCLGSLDRLAFSRPDLAGSTNRLSSRFALGQGWVVCNGRRLKALLHGPEGTVSFAQPVAKPLVAEPTHALISLSRTARSVVDDLTR